MNKEKVLIVGAGMGGLTAAAYLIREDYDVLLLEKNDRIGGLVNTFEKDGFFFDGGPRAFVNSGMVRPILKDLGIELEYFRNRISIGIEDHLFRVDSMESLNEYKRVLLELFPDNRQDIEEITAQIKKISDYTKVLYQFDNPNFVDLTKDKRFIFRELLPWTIKLLFTLRKFDKLEMPMEEFMGRYTSNQSLTDMLLQHFFRKTPTHFALGYFYVYMDYFYPREGTGSLPKSLGDRFCGEGGKIQLNTEIIKVNSFKKTVTDKEGNDYSYDHLVWAADLKTLYRILNSHGWDQNTINSIDSEAKRVLSAKGAESSFILFAAVDRPLSYFKENGGEHLFYTANRKGLGDTNKGKRQDLLDNFKKKSKGYVKEWLKDFCQLNTYEVSIPALRDPSLAPEGKSGLMISCLFDYALAKKIDEAGWHESYKELMEKNIIELFSGTIYKDIEKDILFKFSSTPVTINKLCGSSEGAITGWSYETEIPVKDKLKEIPKSVFTEIPDVYKAGQWAYAPAGVPVAMLTGWHAMKEIVKKSKERG
jgi:phytoene dehydrogenase-like protein